MRRLHGDSGTGHGDIAESELLSLEISGQFPDELVKIGVQIHCNLPDVLTIGGIKEISLGGLLLQSTRYFLILSSAVSLSDLSISLG